MKNLSKFQQEKLSKMYRLTPIHMGTKVSIIHADGEAFGVAWFPSAFVANAFASGICVKKDTEILLTRMKIKFEKHYTA